jgi:Ca-activated chloride channel family protein
MSANQHSGQSDNLDWTAYALRQLNDAERARVEKQLARATGKDRSSVQGTRMLAEKVREALVADHLRASDALRKKLVHRLGDPAESQLLYSEKSAFRSRTFRWIAGGVLAASLAGLLVVLAARQGGEQGDRKTVAQHSPGDLLIGDEMDSREDGEESSDSDALAYQAQGLGMSGEIDSDPALEGGFLAVKPADPSTTRHWSESPAAGGTADAPVSPAPIVAFSITDPKPASQDGQSPGQDDLAKLYQFRESGDSSGAAAARGSGKGDGQSERPEGWAYGNDPNALAGMSGHGAGGMRGGSASSRSKDVGGGGMMGMGMGASGGIAAKGMQPNENYDSYQKLGGRAAGSPLAGAYGEGERVEQRFGTARGAMGMDVGQPMMSGMMPGAGPGAEQYAPIQDNDFVRVQGLDALSTFSIDVDTASYANVRRFLTQGQLPPPDAVRLEELVNYFSYDYPQPKPGEPFSVNLEVAECPWQQKHLLLRVGLKGREIHHKERPVSNLVFLLDVSGSMSDQDKLPLLKQVLSMMVRELREDDRVSIVTYAGEAGLRLPPTTGDQQTKILQAIDTLTSGGSTNGSAGIELAYEQAQAYFRKEGTNRVILATDGDLNVGVTDDESLVRLIKEKAAGGTFLTVLGFGEGNLKDAKMERLADNGNGLYAYIDSVREGRKVLIEQMSGSLVTIAKDVKIQVEFNPREVQSYRLLGYENRMLTAPEFSDDKRDAGEIGAGHSVTALYELVPTGLAENKAPRDAAEPPLRYQDAGGRGQESGVRSQETGVGGLTEAAASGELLSVRLRYKEPDGVASKLSEYPLKDRGGKFSAATKDFQFASAVASFGMILRNSQYRGDGNLAAVAEIAAAALGEDKGGYRAEFVDLVTKAQEFRSAAGVSRE